MKIIVVVVAILLIVVGGGGAIMLNYARKLVTEISGGVFG
jgi:type III secretory pathway component EscS